MKRVLIYILVLVGLFSFSCKENHEHHHHDHEDVNMPAGVASDGSLYELEEIWTTQDGKLIQLSEFKDQPILISMFYASCTAVCPRIISDMQKIAEQIKAKSNETPKLVLVSFDPEKDTKEVLKTYATKMKLTENWVLLNGSEDSVRTLSVVLGINYKKSGTGDFNHSTVISLLTPSGKIYTRLEGIGADSKPILDYYK